MVAGTEDVTVVVAGIGRKTAIRANKACHKRTSKS